MTGEVTIGHDDRGEVHAVDVSTKDIDSHPQAAQLHEKLQAAVSAISPGVSARVGVPKEQAIAAMDAGRTPEELAEAVKCMAMEQWAMAVFGHGQCDVGSEVVHTGVGEVAVTTVRAVVFTDQQFGEFLVSIKAAALDAIDEAVKQTQDSVRNGTESDFL